MDYFTVCCFGAVGSGKKPSMPKLGGGESLRSPSRTSQGVWTVWCDYSPHQKSVIHFTSALVTKPIMFSTESEWPNDNFEVLRMTLLPLMIFFPADGKGEVHVPFPGQPQSSFKFTFSQHFLNCHLGRRK